MNNKEINDEDPWVPLSGHDNEALLRKVLYVAQQEFANISKGKALEEQKEKEKNANI